MPAQTPLRRLAAIALAALVAGVTLVPVDADARPGRSGSFGSRGSKTFSSPPPTATAPNPGAVQRSTTPAPSQTQPGLAGAQQRRPGFFGGGFGAALMGGLLGAGLFGLLSGSGLFGGLGSLASILGLLIQVALVVIVVRLALNWWRRRQQSQGATAYQGAGPSPRPSPGFRFDAPSGGGLASAGRGFGFGGAAPQVAPLTLEASDFEAFERRLGEVQAAWSAQDVDRLRSLTTPEILDVFEGDLADDASRGVVNRTGSIKLLQGDLSEAWREGERDYATVAMRYQLTDATFEKATGRVVDGDPDQPVEATELWTFVRVRGGDWTLSAIQQSN